VNRLREERRDLFDLLYGDESVSTYKTDDGDDENDMFPGNDDDDLPSKRRSTDRFGLDDDDLDSFDPYGLENY